MGEIGWEEEEEEVEAVQRKEEGKEERYNKFGAKPHLGGHGSGGGGQEGKPG